MQSIEEAAKEYLKDCVFERDPINAFRAGVEFAQQWHSVEKELPEWYTGCRLDILVKKETFKYPASVIVHTIYSDKDIQELKEMYTHWRYLELK